jgi:hypothetical protein
MPDARVEQGVNKPDVENPERFLFFLAIIGERQ